MVDPAVIMMVKDIVTILGVIGGFTYYVITVGHQNSSRKAQLFMEMYRDFKRPDIQKAYNDIVNIWQWDSIEEFNEKYGPDNNYEEFQKYMLVYSVYEGLGVLIYRNLIDVTMIEELMRSYVVNFFEKMSPIIYDWRVKWPIAAEWTEYLYKEVKKIQSIPAYERN